VFFFFFFDDRNNDLELVHWEIEQTGTNSKY